MALLVTGARSTHPLAAWLRNDIADFLTPANKALLLFGLTFTAISTALQVSIGDTSLFYLTDYLSLMALLVPTFLLAAAVIWFFRMVFFVRPQSPLRHARKALSLLFSQQMLLRRTGPIFLYLFLVMSAYSGLKGNIDLFNTYSWDPFFADLDKMLFFGAEPWQVVHELFPGLLWAEFFNVAYHLWFFLMFALWFWAAGMPDDDRDRITFLFAYGLCWTIGGLIVAIFFASVGPCYYERLLGDGRYADLMRTLRGYDLMALDVQDGLWEIYAVQGKGAGAGLSAFPSMHCASSTLFALFGFSRSRALGSALSAFALVIFIGSIYLGWHYAVDGIAGALIAVGCWFAARRIADRIRGAAKAGRPAPAARAT